MQPTPYTQTTDFSEQEAAAASGRSTVNTALLDSEFSNIETTLDQVIANAALIQRDDGLLADSSVGVNALSRSVLNLIGDFTARGAWATETSYAVGDIVDNGGILYLCQTAHTSPGAFVESPNWARFGFSGSEDAAISAGLAAASAAAAATAEANAETAEVAAEAAATAAAASASAASSSQSAAAASAGTATSAATNAANSAVAAAASAAAVTLPIPIASGGTGQTSASTALVALGGASTTALALSSGSNTIGFIQAGTGAAARTVQAVMRESLSVKDFGAVGDGATNNLTAFTNALAAAAGKKLRIPAGNYRIEFTGGTNAITLPASIVVEGDGRDTTTITFVPSTTALSYFFNLSNDEFTLRGVTITNAVPAGGNGCVFKGGADFVTVEDCDIDGGVTNSGESLSHICYGVICVGTGAQNDQVFRGNIFRRLTYPWLKANTDTAEQRRLKFVGNTFHSNYYNDLGLNSPSGVCDDVLIDGNTFRNNLSISSIGPTQALGIALASVTNFRVVNNHLMDSYTDAIHIEEACSHGVVSNNTLNVDGAGIEFNANDVGGSLAEPSNIVVSNNTVKKQGTAREASKYGIRLIFTADSELPAKNLLVTGNIIDSFDYGLWSVAGLVGSGSMIANDTIIVKGNLFKDCAIGMGLSDGTLSVQGNTTATCTVGISATSSASTTETCIVESHTFISDTTYVDAIDRKFTLIDPMWVFPEFDHAGGSTSVYKTLLPAAVGDRIHGYLEMSADASGATAGSSKARDEVTWDGTTFTKTSKLLFAASGLQVLAAQNSSNLVVNVFASSAMTGIRLNARLNGMAVISV